MIKIKELRAVAREHGLKLSATALAGAERATHEVVAHALKEAAKAKAKKLEGKHFANVIVLNGDGTEGLKRMLAFRPERHIGVRAKKKAGK